MKLSIHSKLRDYDVIIEQNLIKKIHKYIDNTQRYVIITEDGIPELYIDTLTNQIDKHHVIEFNQGESSKNMDTYLKIIQELNEISFTKTDILIALGGGVVTDITGFVASTYLRGVEYIQIPTTLLAQVDASIGGKTGLNHLNNKNIIGSIYPPSLVLIDPQTLLTLSNRQMNNGMAEVIKCALIDSKELFEIIQNKNFFYQIEKIIYLSLKTKIKYIELDEFDQHERHVLNFGHTLGHAYESYYKYQKYLHGEAIALGMYQMIFNQPLRNKVKLLLEQYHLPISDSLDPYDLFDFIKKDKKRINQSIKIIVLNDIEKPEIIKVSLKTFLHDYLERKFI
ncbi:3-dehydroquinate synthase [Hujiaoplasma nucleasis]|uniref:3-dehydroquinate synthase n=1 Tax=Hujiaoplasma nucleasis TaxID=2725268 RepID=A0A7L6N7D8_9MOLU|nr:3-dehydroquinate synthase family protein [Hujiaoplasma nucleasis]QLY40444.1 3-dehydroquinate synthase [Hujiaoplasma nucleasis]